MKRALYILLLPAMVLIMAPGCSDEDAGSPPENGDDTLPRLIGSSPYDNETDVSRSGPYWFAFSEAMDVESVQDNITVSPDFGHDIHANAAADTFWLTPHISLGERSKYTFTVGTGCEDQAGNAMAAAVDIGFTTTSVQDMDPPTVVSTFPADGAVDVSDFNLWNTHRFMASGGIQAVPEPISLTPAIGLALALLIGRRRA